MTGKKKPKAHHEERSAPAKLLREIVQSRAILEALGDAISIQDRTFKILYENQVHKDMLGDHVGEYCYRAYTRRKGLCDGCNLALTFKDGAVHKVLRELQSDEGTRYFEITSSPLKDTKGRIIAGIEVVRDITERRRAEQLVLNERDKANNYLDIAGVILLVIDPDKRVKLINKKGCEVLGYNEEETIGKDWLNTFTPDRERESVKDVFEQLMAGEVEPVEYFENFILTKSGEERLIAWHNTLLRDESGKVVGTLSSGEDITEQKQAEQALKDREQELQIQAHNLEEANIALKVLLTRRDQDKVEFEEKILLNVKELVSPYLERLRTSGLDERQKNYVDILESNLIQITSAFSHRLSFKFLNFTPTEIQVADLLRQGKTNKEIGELLNSSSRTVAFHRDNIRKKLGLKNKKTNLKSYLLSLK